MRLGVLCPPRRLFRAPSRSSAAASFPQVRAFDPAASLSILPLGTVWDDLPKSTAEAKRLATAAAPPAAGTSTDLRLFTLRAFADEESAAAKLLGSARPAAGAIPVYWEPSLLVQPDGAPEPMRPYFFRLSDLQATH